jgi:hypothetical protein
LVACRVLPEKLKGGESENDKFSAPGGYLVLSPTPNMHSGSQIFATLGVNAAKNHECNVILS